MEIRRFQTILNAPRRAPRAAEDAPTLARRPVVARRPAPVDSLWYRAKKAAANVLCNMDVRLAWFRYVRRIDDDTALQVAPQLKPGDILLRRTEGTSGNVFIPSWWKHAAVYVGGGKIVEATFKGVVETTLDDFFAHGDHVSVVRPKDFSKSQSRAMVTHARAQLGKPYDFDMDFDDASRVSCTELAANAVGAATKKPLVKRNWLDAVVADAFHNPNFDVVYNSTPQSP